MGSFAVGKDFDALLINTMAEGAPFDTFWCEWVAASMCLCRAAALPCTDQICAWLVHKP